MTDNVNSAADSNPKWYYSRWGVLLLLFLIAGPLGLPFLFKSEQFSKFWKIVITVITAVYFVTIIVLLISLELWFVHRIVCLQYS
ncbi:MAG: hypothetical protein ACP5FK_00525 [bacterium]